MLPPMPPSSRQTKEALIACHFGPPFAMGVEVECRHARPGSIEAARAWERICRVGEHVEAADGGIRIKLRQKVPSAVTVTVVVVHLRRADLDLDRGR